MGKSLLLFRLLITGVILLPWTTISYAQSGYGVLEGRILSAEGKPAAGITVHVNGTRLSVATNEGGEFRLDRVRAGQTTLHVTAVGLAPVDRTVTVRASDKVSVDISLSENWNELQEVWINAQQNSYKADRPSTSLRINTPLLEVPQNIQVISSGMLSDQQVLSMEDGVIRNVSGATRLEHWGGMYTRVNMRGSRASSFRNGMNITSSWGPLSEDMSFVERIEVIKGPAGFMMSNSEPSGIYNVVTKKPTGSDFNGMASFTMGSYDLYRTALDLDGKLDKEGKLAFRLNAMGTKSNSVRDFEFNQRTLIAPVLTYNISDATSLTLEYTYQRAKMSNVGSFYMFSPDGYGTYPRNVTLLEPGLEPSVINDHSAFAYLNHRINENWKLTAQLGYFNYDMVGSSSWVNDVRSNGEIDRYVSIWDAVNENRFGQVFLNGDVQTGAVRHRILGGLDLGTKSYMADWAQAYDLNNADHPFNPANPVYNDPVNGLPVFDRSQPLSVRAAGNLSEQSYTGLYAQDELGFLDNTIRLTLGGRYTWVRDLDYLVPRNSDRFTPRLGLSVSIDRYSSVYALYDQTFTPQSGIMRSGGAPKPITGNNMELGLKRDWFNGKLRSSISAYRILKNNTLTTDPDNQGTEGFVIDVGQSRTQGIELDIQGEILPGLLAVVNYAYTDSEISKTSGAENLPATAVVGARIPGYATHEANASLRYALQRGALKGSGIYGGFTYLGDRDTWTWPTAIDQMGLPDYYKFDAGLFWGKDRIQVNLNVYNVLDTYLYTGSAYETYYYYQAEPGRNFRLGINYRF